MEREISLTGGGPWGFTLSGGKDFGAPLKVSKVRFVDSDCPVRVSMGAPCLLTFLKY